MVDKWGNAPQCRWVQTMAAAFCSRPNGDPYGIRTHTFRLDRAVLCS